MATDGIYAGSTTWCLVRVAALVPASTYLTLDGSNGFVINGIQALTTQAVSVSSAGDINGDGIDDLIIGTGNGTGRTELRGVWQK